jgi:hypothetical protein
MPDNLPFKVVRTNGHEEIVARTNNLLVGRAAFETARRLYPNERVDYRDGARIIAHSEPEKRLALDMEPASNCRSKLPRTGAMAAHPPTIHPARTAQAAREALSQLFRLSRYPLASSPFDGRLP